DDVLAIHRGSERRTTLAPLCKVGSERVLHRAEARVASTVDLHRVPQAPFTDRARSVIPFIGSGPSANDGTTSRCTPSFANASTAARPPCPGHIVVISIVE